MRFHFFQTILKSAETMLMEFINCFNIGIWKIVPKYSWKMPPPPITVYRNNFVPNEPNELGGDISRWMEDSGIPELWANFEPSVRVEHPNETEREQYPDHSGHPQTHLQFLHRYMGEEDDMGGGVFTHRRGGGVWGWRRGIS